MPIGRGKTITFPAGLPGLPAELTGFELVAVAEDSPFFFLQSLQDENTGFILVNPFFFFPEYEFDLPGEDAQALGIKTPEEAAVFCIVNAGRGLAHATVNLLAPVVVNAVTGAARQVVLVDERYGARHPLPILSSAQTGVFLPQNAPGEENESGQAPPLKGEPRAACGEKAVSGGEGS